MVDREDLIETLENRELMQEVLHADADTVMKTFSSCPPVLLNRFSDTLLISKMQLNLLYRVVSFIKSSILPRRFDFLFL